MTHQASPKDEAPTVAGLRLQGPTENQQAEHSDLDADRKAFSTLAARLALRGYGVFELACGGFLISRWDRNVHCSDSSGVRAFFQRIGGIE